MKYDYWSESEWRRVIDDLGLDIANWSAALHLYPAIVDWLFGGSLHFLADLRVPDATEPG